ncbi:TetR/AcrR family transcriptional regulator [Actinocorallia sp. API 0066]|uniref:TetR/AcrR family transcriptional regulator n=1 Tax=Actinocorallia sp. API 0066 TaxID=2896846 RepID=UPI001E62A580|nr:TetR/AcrR family transcriptional regulator [Actinocorallia sp. API 0066]MCD0452086.1 TetR/AcrR family transcriptional regulator [Actinocorallia sp. API 0066]
MPEPLSDEQVVETATRLFSGLGYDMTSLELLAEALGVPTSAIVTLVGNKRELYLRVMGRIFEARRARMQVIVDSAVSAHTAAHELADSYLDFYSEHPDFLALWTHRWAADAANVPEVEDLYVRPLMHLAAHKIRDAVPGDIDVYAFWGVVLWCINGFLGTGLLAPGAGMTRADNPKALAYFRIALHTVIDHMLTTPSAPLCHPNPHAPTPAI